MDVLESNDDLYTKNNKYYVIVDLCLNKIELIEVDNVLEFNHWKYEQIQKELELLLLNREIILESLYYFFEIPFDYFNGFFDEFKENMCGKLTYQIFKGYETMVVEFDIIDLVVKENGDVDSTETEIKVTNIRDLV